MADIPFHKTTSPRATNNADDDMSVFLHHLLSSSPASASAASAPQYALTSDSALALAAKRAAGFAPQASSAAGTAASSGWDFFPDGKNPPPRLDLPRPTPLPPDRDRTSTAESSAVVDSMFRAASGNIPDFTEKKEADGAGESDASAGRRRKAAADTDFDEYDGESEEGGMDAPEVPAKPFPSRSGGKRSRAAEVHNLSEKRRRSRINEKMKALQNLIPNSNKTDKASMLDEAIEYLKQLQLQVQMLSMRNGLSLHPMYLPGTLQPLQVPQMHVAFGAGSASLNVNMGVGMQTVSQDSATQSPFLSNQSNPAPHQPMGIPGITNITSSHSAFDLDLTRAHHGPHFQLPSAVEEIYSEVTQQNHLDASQSAANPAGRSS